MASCTVTETSDDRESAKRISVAPRKGFGRPGKSTGVSRDVAMIDPKINLRVSAATDLDLLCLATELTRKGLGFPQYSNDDVVIPGLAAHGYDLEDARDYVVAACWEFIIPGRGLEVVNIGAVSFPAAVDQAMTANPATIGPTATVEEAARLMLRLKIGALAGRCK